MLLLVSLCVLLLLVFKSDLPRERYHLREDGKHDARLISSKCCWVITWASSSCFPEIIRRCWSVEIPSTSKILVLTLSIVPLDLTTRIMIFPVRVLKSSACHHEDTTQGERWGILLNAAISLMPWNTAHHLTPSS